MDRLRWYCEGDAGACKNVFDEEQFFCESLEALGPVIVRHFRSEERRTCDKCGWQEAVPEKMAAIIAKQDAEAAEGE